MITNYFYHESFSSFVPIWFCEQGKVYSCKVPIGIKYLSSTESTQPALTKEHEHLRKQQQTTP